MAVQPARRPTRPPVDVDAIVAAIERFLRDPRETVNENAEPAPHISVWWQYTRRRDAPFWINVKAERDPEVLQELKRRYVAAGYVPNKHVWIDGAILVIVPVPA